MRETQDAQTQLMSVVKILSAFDFSVFVPAVFEENTSDPDDDCFNETEDLLAEVQDGQENLDPIIAKAEAGDSDAQFWMGKRYLDQEVSTF